MACVGSDLCKALRNGARAALVTIHGEMDVAKLLAKKGPNGAASQACISLADQSFRIHIPKKYSSACVIEIGVPS